MGSSIKINSISIDLAGVNDEVDNGKCEHFSIRGFVSEIRKRDRKKCWPFSLNDDTGEQVCVLPPLSVPKSRWWCCESCLQEIGTESNPSGNDFGADKNENVNHKRIHIDDIVLLKKDGCRSTDSCRVGKTGKRISSLEHASEKSKGKVSTSKKIRQTKNCRVKNVQNAEVMRAFGSSDVAGVVDDTPKGSENCKNDHLSMELDEFDNLSSESAILMRRNFRDHNPHSIIGSHCRKTRKVRSLSELLGKADTKTSVIRNQDSQSKRGLVKGRKRKLAEDEEWRPAKLSPQNNYANRNVMTIGENSESTIQSSDSEDNSVSGIGLQTSEESKSTDNEFDRDPIKGKKRNKRFQVVDEQLLEISREYSQKGVQETDGDSDKVDAVDSTLVSSVRSAFAGRELVPCPLHTPKTDEKSFLSKKKNKKPLIGNKKNLANTFSNSTLEQNLIKVRKTEFMKSSPTDSAVQNVSNAKGFDLPLDNFQASERYAESELEDRLLISFPRQQLPLKKDYITAKDAKANHFQDFGLSSKSEQDACLRTGVYIELSGKNNAHRMSFLNQKLRHGSATEVGDYSLIQQRDISNSQDKGKTVVIQEHSTKSRSQSDHTAEKSPEHLDDIPMEIVELMAKNQYERCLPDGEDYHNDRRPSQATTTSKNALLIDLNKTYDNGVSQEDNNNTSRKPKVHGKNPRKVGEKFLTAKQKSFDFFTINQFGQAYIPSGLGMFPQNQEYPSSSIHFSGIGSSGHTSTSNNCHCFRNMANADDQNPSSSSFRVLRPCNTCQSVPHQYKETSDHPWLSMIPPNHMQVPHKMPQKYMDHSTKLDMLSGAPNNCMNSWNLNFLNPGNQKHGFHSEYPSGCKHSGFDKSVDQYSNESSIPAMHLLSLMDPQLRSNTSVDPTGNGKFPKKTSFCQVHRSKELVGLQPREYNRTTDLMKGSAFGFYNKRLSPEASQEAFNSIPTGTSAFSLQNNRNFSNCCDFIAQAPMKHQDKKGKRKVDISSIHNSKKSVFSSGDLQKFRFPGASDSTVPPLKFHSSENARKQKGKTQSHNAVVWTPKSNSGSAICGVNRNPADFTVAEPGNPYMTKGKDLKVRRRFGLEKKTALYNGQKQNKKLVAYARENV